MAQYMWPGLISEVIMQFTEKYSTTLSMLPVCECGHVIRDVKANIHTKRDGWHHLDCTISPTHCPNCGAHIDCLQIDGKYVEMFLKR